MPDFNAQQAAAITAENPVLLCSAGAGAGKTSVMTERIARLIEKGRASLSEMIVITFTRDAARSMREKIESRLKSMLDNADPQNAEAITRFQESLTQLPVSNISTIHSFCSNIVRSGYYMVGIDSDRFSIVESDLRRIYFDQAVRAAIEKISEKGYSRDAKRAFGAFARAVSTDDMTDICFSAYNTLMGVSEPFSRMERLVDQVDLPYTDNPWAKELVSYYRNVLLCKSSDLQALKGLYNNPAFPASFLAVLQQDITSLEQMLPKVETATSVDDLLSAVNPVVSSAKDIRAGKMSPQEKELYEVFKGIHGTMKNKSTDDAYLTKVVSVMNAIKNPGKTNTQIKNQLKGLQVLLAETYNCFRDIKNEHGVLDYADLEQYAYQILTSKEHPEVLEDIHKTYRYLFVDECQDISEIQYALIQALKGPDTSLFMVGDIKQSIYRFRHADPLLFLHLRDTYSFQEDAPERKIFFQHNYRSSSAILESVNAVFSSAMSRKHTEIDYEKEDHLIPGRPDIPPKPVDVVLVEDSFPSDPRPGVETKDPIEAQCVEVGEMIQKYLKDGYDYKDIVILLRSAKTYGPQIAAWLSKLHIPCYFNGKQSFFDVPEVSQLIDLLKVIDNDRNDYSLISALKSVPFSFSDEDLGTIRADYSKDKFSPFSNCFHACADKNTTPLEKKAHAALDLIHLWQVRARISLASDMIWMLLKDYGFYATQGAMPGGEIRTKNLYAFHQKALSCEAGGEILKLSDFLDYIRLLSRGQGGGDGDEPVPMSDNDNFVRIMTIHSSKGLEYPVVILMNLQQDIHRRQSKTNVQINISSNAIKPALGLYMRFCNRGIGLHRESYGLVAFRARAYMDDLAEETRVLYVAMTRARERLLLVGVAKKKSVPLWTNSSRDYRIFNASSSLDMIMPAVASVMTIPDAGQEASAGSWHVMTVLPRPVTTSAQAAAAFNLPVRANDIDFRAEWESLKPSLVLPAKTAVTAVAADRLEPRKDAEVLPDDESDEDIPEISGLSLPDEPEKPSFMRPLSERTSANVGSILHKFMFLLDFVGFDAQKNTINIGTFLSDQLNGMIHDSTLSAADKDVVSEFLYGIGRFLKSPVGSALCASNAMREQTVVFTLPVQGQEILVQGVLDAMYPDEDGNWVIVDYKTDRKADRDTLIEKHSRQLNLYRFAVERITGKPVSHMYIVSLRTGQHIDVPKEDLSLIA